MLIDGQLRGLLVGRACVPANEILGVENNWQIELAWVWFARLSGHRKMWLQQPSQLTYYATEDSRGRHSRGGRHFI